MALLTSNDCDMQEIKILIVNDGSERSFSAGNTIHPLKSEMSPSDANKQVQW